MQLLGGIKSAIDTFDPKATTCEGMKGCATANEGQRTDAYSFTDANGEHKQIVLKTEAPTTPGQLLLFKMSTVGAYIDAIKESSPEQAQLLLVGLQAVMGPAKAAVGLAGNALIGALLGDQITAAKDKISLSIAAGLSGKDAELIAASGQSVGEVHKEGFIDQAGDAYLNGAKTLLDIALGSSVAAVGLGVAKVTGRAVTVFDNVEKSISDSPHKTPLPANYAEVAGVGAQVSTPIPLPAGYRMVRNIRSGTYEVLGTDGVIYVERNGVLKPKAGGNLAELAAAEKEIAAGGAKGVPGSTLTREELISGLPVGTKITPANVVDIRRLPDGRTVWLEKGTDAAGLQHIYKRHEADFVNKGISREDIPDVVMSALERGEIVGVNGSANVYRITHNGVEQNIAVGVSSNGFVVRANPVSSWKPLP
jgi:hypothetical protein